MTFNPRRLSIPILARLPSSPSARRPLPEGWQALPRRLSPRPRLPACHSPKDRDDSLQQRHRRLRITRRYEAPRDRLPERVARFASAARRRRKPCPSIARIRERGLRTIEPDATCCAPQLIRQVFVALFDARHQRHQRFDQFQAELFDLKCHRESSACFGLAGLRAIPSPNSSARGCELREHGRSPLGLDRSEQTDKINLTRASHPYRCWSTTTARRRRPRLLAAGVLACSPQASSLARRRRPRLVAAGGSRLVRRRRPPRPRRRRCTSRSRHRRGVHVHLHVLISRSKRPATATVASAIRAASWQPLYLTKLRETLCPGTELNRRHEDFQSSALPTELPRRWPEGRSWGLLATGERGISAGGVGGAIGKRWNLKKKIGWG